MFPRWLSWLFVAFIVYLLYLGARAPHEAAAPVSTQVVSLPRPSPTLAATFDPERWKRTINPDYAAKTTCDGAEKFTGGPGLKILEDRSGVGKPASCGDTIAVQLTVWNAQGAKAYDGAFDLPLGAQALAAGLDGALVGIRPGGTRTVLLPPGALAHAKKTTVPKAALAAFAQKRMVVVTVTRK
jgi:hypothetical protein